MSGLFGETPKTPEPKSPAPMPDDQSPSVIEAKRRKELDIMSRGGRSSTILTDGGGGSYSGTKLGAA